MTDYNAMLRQLFTAPARGMTAQPPQANFGSGLLGNMLTKAHGLLDPVQAMGGYGNLAAMALPPGAPRAALVPKGPLGPGFRKFSRAGETVDGLRVREDIPNTSSIGASLSDYNSMSGIREVPFSAFDKMGPLGKLDARTQSLASEIAANKEINPLIVAMDELGPYIVEGGHRFDALRSLNKKSFPAIVVRDLEALGQGRRR
jgi:hypothetical protein